MADFTGEAFLNTTAQWASVIPAPGDGQEPTAIEATQMESTAGAATVTTGLWLVPGLELAPGVEVAP